VATLSGRTLAAAVLRPLAEQLVDEAQLQSGERVLEISGGDGQVTRWLVGAELGDAFAVAAIVADDERAQQLRAAIAPAHVDVMVAQSWALPFNRGDFAVAISLLAIDREDLNASLDEVSRVTDRALVAAWGDGAVHEKALRDAWLAVTGHAPPLPPVVHLLPPPARWQQRTLSDVARFDGIDQLWAALVSERGIDDTAVPAATIRAGLGARLAQHTAADGTLRIPVRAELFALG
jgi:hypothetical protein